MKENFAVVEVYSGRYYQGFKTLEEAQQFVHKELDKETSADYEYRTLKVIDEWSGDKLLPNEVNY